MQTLDALLRRFLTRIKVFGIRFATPESALAPMPPNALPAHSHVGGATYFSNRVAVPLLHAASDAGVEVDAGEESFSPIAWVCGGSREVVGARVDGRSGGAR